MSENSCVRIDFEDGAHKLGHSALYEFGFEVRALAVSLLLQFAEKFFLLEGISAPQELEQRIFEILG